MFKSSKSAATLPQRDAYIPPHVESAMAGHVQQSLPPHLQKYKGGNTYIPEHAQQEMTQHLEKSLPPHMKQYAGAYMQQSIVQPSLARRGVATPPMPPEEASSVTPHAPAVVQPTVAVGRPPTPGQNPPANGPQASYASRPDQVPSADQAYGFITNPQEPSKQSPISGFLAGGSVVKRIAVIAVGVFILLVVFIVLRGLLSNSPDLTSFVTIAQEQQELIHLVSGDNAAQQQANLSSNNKDLSATIQTSLATSQSNTLQYLTNNDKKVDAKQLNLKISTTADKQLEAAAAAGTYNQTFTEILQAKLKAYNSTLSAAYNQTQGQKGKALLKDSYYQAQLFQTQLNTGTN